MKKKNTVIAITLAVAMLAQLSGCGSAQPELPQDAELMSDAENVGKAQNTEEVENAEGRENAKNAEFDDHVMDWKDDALEEAVRRALGREDDSDIMLSDVWELTALDLSKSRIKDISALSELVHLTEYQRLSRA